MKLQTSGATGLKIEIMKFLLRSLCCLLLFGFSLASLVPGVIDGNCDFFPDQPALVSLDLLSGARTVPPIKIQAAYHRVIINVP